MKRTFIKDETYLITDKHDGSWCLLRPYTTQNDDFANALVFGLTFSNMNHIWRKSSKEFLREDGQNTYPYLSGKRVSVYDREVRLATDLEKYILDRVAQIGALTDEEIRELKIDLVLE